MITVENGSIDLKIPTGYYRLEEKKAPAGYVIEDKFIMFHLSLDEQGNVVIDGIEPAEKGHEWVNDILWIANPAGKALPITGGEGTMKFMVAGAILMLTGLCFGCALRRRERRFDF